MRPGVSDFFIRKGKVLSKHDESKEKSERNEKH